MKSSGHGAVIDPLLTLEREDLTGALEFRARGVTTTIFTRAGEIVFAEGGALGETLGRLLVRRRRVEAEHLGALIQRLTDAVIDETVVQLGDIAVQYGFLTRDELDVALIQQVTDKIIGCIRRGPGEWRFIADAPRAIGADARVVRLRPTLMEASSSFAESFVEQVLELHVHRFPELVAPAKVVADEFELTREEAAILADLNGTSSLHFLLPIASSPRLPALIAALVLGGGVVLQRAPSGSPAPADARPVPPDFVTRRRAGARPEGESRPIPRIQSAADAESISTLRAARPAAEHRSSRENIEPWHPEAATRARAAFARLSEDLEARKPVSEGQRWSAPKSDHERRLMAEAAFHLGLGFLHNDAADRALPGLHHALDLCPDEPEYELFVKWAQLLVSDAFGDAARRGEIEALAADAARRDGFCALAFAVLGHCALRHEKEEPALRLFQRARLLDPKLVDPTKIDALLAATAAGKGATSRPNLRTRARRDLVTPLDEIVPVAMPRERAATPGDTVEENTDPEASPPDSDVFDPDDRRTPFGGLQMAPFADAPAAAPETPRPAPSSPRSLFPPSRMSSLPPPAPASPQPPPSKPEGTPFESGPAPMRAAPSPRRIAVATPAEAAPARSEAAPAAAAAPQSRSPVASSIDVDVKVGKRKTTRRMAFVAFGLGSLGMTALAFHRIGSREPPAALDAAPFTTRSSAVLPPAASPPPAPSAAPMPTESASSSVPPTTAILRTPKGWGHRVFFDGHSLGDGGRDLTVPCGAHRVKVGSTGVERTVNLPCGGSLTVE